MKISTFFKVLNRKIDKYNQVATNPFMTPHPITLVWVEEEKFHCVCEYENQNPDKNI